MIARPTVLFALLLHVPASAWAQNPATAEPEPTVAAEAVRAAGALNGLEFTDDEIELMLDDLRAQLGAVEALRRDELPNGLLPAQLFTPWVPGIVPRTEQWGEAPVRWPQVQRPVDLAQVATWSITELGALLRQGDVTSVELTRMYLDRLRALDSRLHCVITFLDERALEQAAARDAELAAGRDRGPLHGIPWGVKDLMAVEGARTTWGAAPFREQRIDSTATVVQRLDAAGAVLLAKLSVGALAWGDVWFEERTRSPWNTDAGSSGSSAGSASATAAGGVAFSLGTETLGSIVSPCVACAAAGLRPTFGRVPRTGVMALSWTMDKVGPITRSVADADLVFRALRGADSTDPFSRDGRVPVRTATDSPPRRRIGVPAGAFRGQGGLAGVRSELEALGHELVEIELPDLAVDGLLLTLSAEAATAFDELTRSGRDQELVRQVQRAWPNVFRVARLIPAVEYLRAQRLRTRAMGAVDRALAGVDLLVHPPYASGVLQITNLTGHPTVVSPYVPGTGPRGDGSPFAICFTGGLDRDEELLAVVAEWERAHPEHRLHPPLPWLPEAAAAIATTQAPTEPPHDGR